MRWHHEACEQWLAERKKYLTASEIQRLLPTTPTGRKRDVESVQLAVWAEKQAGVTQEDIESKAAAARGHLLEPYAIAAFNAIAQRTQLYHWDNMLVYDGLTAYSPDALDVPMLGDEPILPALERQFHPSVLGEVKSYAPKTHYLIAKSDKADLDERWQIATAMHVSPMIDQAHLILYNPNVKHPLFVHSYTRAELSSELQVVSEVVEAYWEAVPGIEFGFNMNVLSYDGPSEQEIIEELQQGMQLNPQ